jgi:chemotaxis protein methyltransferase CheR
MKTAPEIAFLSEIVGAQAGHALGPEAANAAAQKLAPLARREAMGDVLELLRFARTQNDPALISAIVEAVLPQDTRFFRERALWKSLRNDVLPAAFKAHGLDKGVFRIWSAGCGFGQEVYSFAMASADALDGSPMPLEIVGTDISERAVERARSGMYTHFEVQRGLPIRLLLKHFERDNDHWRVDNSTRKRTRFARHSLLSDFAPLGAFDIISCQNVLSALSPNRRDQVLSRILAQLKPGGHFLTTEGEGVWLRQYQSEFMPLFGSHIFRRNILLEKSA